jgi:hypothetical protein
MNYNTAVAWLPSGDVYSITSYDAYVVAEANSNVSEPAWDAPHTSTGQYLNRPHYHATWFWVRKGGYGHSFY